jgi:hypothetical protein
MSPHLDPPENADHFAFFVNNERASVDSLIDPSVELFVLDDSVLFADLAVGIAQKQKRKIVFGFEFLVGLDAVFVDADHRCVGGIERADFVTEIV